MSIYDPTVFNILFAVGLLLAGAIGLEVKKHVKNVAVKNAIDVLEKTIDKSVKAVQATMSASTAAALADGTITSAEKAQIIADVIASVKAQLNEDFLLLLGTVFGDLDGVISTWANGSLNSGILSQATLLTPIQQFTPCDGVAGSTVNCSDVGPGDEK